MINDESQEIQVNFNYIIDDFKKAILSFYSNAKAILALAYISLVIIGFTVLFTIFDDTTITFDEIFIVISTSAFFIFLFLIPLLAIPGIKKTWKTTAFGFHVITFTLNDKEIVFRSLLSEVVIPMEYVYKIVELKGFFRIFYNSSEHRILPKRVLNEEELQAIKSILKRNCALKYETIGIRKEKTKKEEKKHK